MNNYTAVRNEGKSHAREVVRSYRTKLARECKTNFKRFRKSINTKLNRKIGVGSLRREDGSEATSDRHKTDVQSDFFLVFFVQGNIANILFFRI